MAKLSKLDERLTEVSDKLLKALAELRDVLSDPDVTPEVEAALSALQDAAAALDDLVPDAPPVE